MTGGTNNGVTRHVGDALVSERSPRLRSGRVVSIGIAPWGIVENRHLLVGLKKDVTYFSVDQPRSKFAALNNRHSYFLLVDNGTAGRYGAEIALRYAARKNLPTKFPTYNIQYPPEQSDHLPFRHKRQGKMVVKETLLSQPFFNIFSLFFLFRKKLDKECVQFFS